MGFVSKLTKSALVKKAIDEARKPQNQAKARQAYERFRAKQGTKAPRH